MKTDCNLKDIARLTGFSINTVSRAVNGKPGVRGETRKQILACAEKIGYVPNMMAKGIRGGSSRLIGALVSNISDNFFVSLLSGIEAEACALNRSILIQNAQEDARRQLEGVRTLLSYGCKDIVVSPVHDCGEVLKLLSGSGANFVVADRVFRSMKNCRRVSINNHGDSKRIVEYMIRCGHRKIALLNQDAPIETETTRTDGYRFALMQHGIVPRMDYQLLCRSEADIHEKINALMRAQDRPTALFIAKDTLALPAVTALRRLNIQIPDDLSVFIYGDPEWAAAFSPGIHGMARPVQDLGRLAVQALFEKTARQSDNLDIVLDSHLIIRNSVRIV